ncbi:MAG TPA: alkaline phosphatase family protein, partial [Acidimicrobiales bacterium]|nr:alkaline phosphatase family protein [Acidimicrobiales bacterium]
LVVSPFSVGGWVCSDTFDHTSQLRFLETRFGVSLPNPLSSWRQSVTGNLTSTLPTLGSPDTKKPTNWPATSDNIDAAPIKGECITTVGLNDQLLELNPKTTPYAVPATQSQPSQGSQVLKPTPT